MTTLEVGSDCRWGYLERDTTKTLLSYKIAGDTLFEATLIDLEMQASLHETTTLVRA